MDDNSIQGSLRPGPDYFLLASTENRNFPHSAFFKMVQRLTQSLHREVSVGGETLSVGQSPPYPRCTSGHEVLPLGQSGRAAKLVGLSIDEMAV
ncbi:hypothetical protein MCEREM21A_01713 [Sphingomonadaceae bacterium]